jgi:hypothetical protein
MLAEIEYRAKSAEGKERYAKDICNCSITFGGLRLDFGRSGGGVKCLFWELWRCAPPELLLQISDSSAEIGLLESKQIRGFAKATTALRDFSVLQMLKLDRHGGVQAREQPDRRTRDVVHTSILCRRHRLIAALARYTSLRTARRSSPR